MPILLVDDSFDTRNLLHRILVLNGHPDVIAVDSAAQAFKILGIGEPNAGSSNIEVILMDIMMPGVDGIDACRRIKADSRLQDIPVLMVTAQPEVEDLQEAFAAGASDYIGKPVHPGVLLARVRHALRLHREIEERKARERDLVAIQVQLQDVNEQLRRLAASDGLTGLANRRHFDEHLEQEWRRAQRGHSPVGLILLDIDCFKAYNDTYGHQAGDDCLRAVAGAIRDEVRRPGDLAARYGGEELAVVLAGTDRAGCEGVARRIHTVIQELAIPHSASAVRSVVTVSGGASARVPERDESPTALIEEADRALYQAKRSGRDRVLMAPAAGAPGAGPGAVT